MSSPDITPNARVIPMSREPWMEHGACRTSPLGPDAWFPERGEDRQPPAVAAQRTCVQECPVAQECLLYALARRERYGIWGGMTTARRDRFIREARKRRAARAGTAA